MLAVVGLGKPEGNDLVGIIGEKQVDHSASSPAGTLKTGSATFFGNITELVEQIHEVGLTVVTGRIDHLARALGVP